jgi:putative tryptophan/tyrosine transport system substrate-binding protein
VLRIGYLSPGTGDPSYQVPYRVGPFRRGLRELGYIEGQSVIVEYRYAGASRERLAEFAAELVKLRVDVIVTASTPGALAAKRATSKIPIVMVDPGDPVAAGLVESMAHPGGNATALTSFAPDLAAKRLQLLRELVSQKVALRSSGILRSLRQRSYCANCARRLRPSGTSWTPSRSTTEKASRVAWRW